MFVAQLLVALDDISQQILMRLHFDLHHKADDTSMNIQHTVLWQRRAFLSCQVNCILLQNSSRGARQYIYCKICSDKGMSCCYMISSMSCWCGSVALIAHQCTSLASTTKVYDDASNKQHASLQQASMFDYLGFLLHVRQCVDSQSV